MEPTASSALRSRPSPGSISSFIEPAMNDALVPNVVMPVSAARSHSTSPAGLPSYRTIEAGVSRTPTRKFHIIHPVVENQKTRSPSCASRCMCIFWRCSSRIPPCPCTIDLGRPVVPLE